MKREDLIATMWQRMDVMIAQGQFPRVGHIVHITTNTPEGIRIIRHRLCRRDIEDYKDKQLVTAFPLKQDWVGTDSWAGEKVVTMVSPDRFIGYGCITAITIAPKGVSRLLDAFNKIGIPTPKILLDNDETIFGCECWWFPESRAKELLEAPLEIDIADIRSGKIE